MAGLGTFADSFVMRFDIQSTERVAKMLKAQAIMEGFYTAAMRACTARVLRTAQQPDYTPVQTGTLRRSLQMHVDAPMIGRVYSANVPYAARREYGFDNQTDSMGRTYAHGDPLFTNDTKRAHMMYLHRALDDNRPFIEETFMTATKEGFVELGKV